jgi:hypothetical protein
MRRNSHSKKRGKADRFPLQLCAALIQPLGVLWQLSFERGDRRIRVGIDNHVDDCRLPRRSGFGQRRSIIVRIFYPSSLHAAGAGNGSMIHRLKIDRRGMGAEQDVLRMLLIAEDLIVQHGDRDRKGMPS